VIVVDASVLATALGDDGPDGDHARARLRGERLSAPELVDLEVASVLRRQVQGGEVDIRRAALALADLAALPLRRAPHRPVLARCWELRDNLTIYDASYVALAEALDVTLLTGDGRLACAPGPRCRIETLRPASLPAAGRSLNNNLDQRPTGPSRPVQQGRIEGRPQGDATDRPRDAEGWARSGKRAPSRTARPALPEALRRARFITIIPWRAASAACVLELDRLPADLPHMPM
jgi:predicted nucleic acid-binding protein